MSSKNPRVLISYTHDSPEHKQRVLKLSNKLLAEGVECHIDVYESSPAKGWPRWMMDQIEHSDFVLVACTKTYDQRFRGNEEPGKGLGAQWEGFVITQEIYETAALNTKFIPIVFSDEEAQHIPIPLRGATRYRVDLDNGYDDLYRRITAQPKIVKPPLGPRRVFDPSQPISAATVSPADQPDRASEAIIPHRDLANLTLLYLSDYKYEFIPSRRIEEGDELALDLLPDDARQTAFLLDIKNQPFRPEMAATFGNNAVQGQISKAVTVHEGRQEVWRVRLKPSKDGGRYSALADFAFNNYTPEDIAELKARRILLNEKGQIARGRDRLSDGIIESMITRDNGLIREVKSPLPELFSLYGHDEKYFLETARLMSVLYLRLSGVVEHIFQLQLKMKEGFVSVEFEGQRALRYANQPAHIIKFSGDCSLNQKT